MQLTPLSALLSVVLAYLLGSIPSGMIVGRVYRDVDLTAHGSGRTGATNVLRTLGPGAAAIVLVADLAKGVLAVLFAAWLSGWNPWAEFLAAVAAVIGHAYSPFIGFKGGRGVLTGLGATFVAAPLPALVGCIVGVIAIALTRYVSLGSILGTTAGGLVMVALGIYQDNPALAAWGVLMAAFIDISHRDNVRRLLAGTERKLGERTSLPT